MVKLAMAVGILPVRLKLRRKEERGRRNISKGMEPEILNP